MSHCCSVHAINTTQTQYSQCITTCTIVHGWTKVTDTHSYGVTTIRAVRSHHLTSKSGSKKAKWHCLKAINIIHNNSQKLFVLEIVKITMRFSWDSFSLLCLFPPPKYKFLPFLEKKTAANSTLGLCVLKTPFSHKASSSSAVIMLVCFTSAPMGSVLKCLPRLSTAACSSLKQWFFLSRKFGHSGLTECM